MGGEGSRRSCGGWRVRVEESLVRPPQPWLPFSASMRVIGEARCIVAFLDDACLAGIGVTRAFFAIEIYLLVLGMDFEACPAAKGGVCVSMETVWRPHIFRLDRFLIYSRMWISQKKESKRTYIHFFGNLAHSFSGQFHPTRRTCIRNNVSSAECMHEKPTFREHKVAADCAVHDSTIELTGSSRIHGQMVL